MIHQLITTWFSWIDQWGLWGVVILMALESSIVPVPSEVVLPPAAFWALQGRYSLVAVIVAGTVGSMLGSLVSYGMAAFFGRTQWFQKLMHWILPEHQWKLLETKVHDYGAGVIFFSRLLPVVRHLISLPAGLFRFDFLKFCISTLIGSTLWCSILTYLGARVLGKHPELMHSPEELIQVFKQEAHVIVLAVIVFLGLYFFVKLRFLKSQKST